MEIETVARVYGGYGGGGYGGHNGNAGQETVMSPTTAAPAAAAGGGDMQSPEYLEQVRQWIAYYAAHPEEDPYISYGGYGAMVAQQYAQGYSQYYGQYPAQSATPGAGAPPPPPSEPAPPGYGSAPPPPPPAGSPSGGYSAVCKLSTHFSTLSNKP